MAIKNYGILKGKAEARKEERDFSSPHYQIFVSTGGPDFRIAINVRSSLNPPDLLFFVDENFQHPLTEDLVSLNQGFTEVERKKDGLALDFIRGNLFDRRKMKALPHNIPNPDNDLNDKLNHYLGRLFNHQKLISTPGENDGAQKLTTQTRFSTSTQGTAFTTFT